MDFIVDFFAEHFENYIWLAVLIIAICPTLESKIAIPFAMNSAIWGNNALSPVVALIISFFGSLIPSFFIMLIARKLKGKTTGFVSSKLLHRYSTKSAFIENKKSNFKKYLALAGFVAVPLPLTGVWTGSLIAGLSNLNLKYAFITISIGTLISTSAITLLCALFENSISYILIISLIIIIAFLFVDLFISIIRKYKKSSKKTN